MTSVLYDAPGPKAKRRSLVASVVVVLVVIALLSWSMVTLAAQGLFAPDRWDVFNDPLIWLRLLEGLGFTLRIAAISAAGAIALGMVLSLLRSSAHRAIRIPVTIVLEFFRGMPVLLMILFILLLFSTQAEVAVIAALIIYNGAIIGEALRSGLASLPRGQREAGLVLGLGSLQTRLLIEFPQAFRTMLPIIVAQLVVLLKDTALGYIVGTQDLIRIGRLLAEFFGAGQYAFSFWVVMLGMFLVVNLTLSAVARIIARRPGDRWPWQRIRRRPTTGEPATALEPNPAAVRGSAGTGDGQS